MENIPIALDSPTPRDTGLDLARAWAVTAMVIGHTLEATLDPTIRDAPLVAAYWPLRSLTAPLFLIVSGWVLGLLFTRRPLSGLGHSRDRLPRFGTLILLGLLLRYPHWAVDRLFSGDPEILAHFFAMDVLPCIALSLLLGSLLAGASLHPGRRSALAGVLAIVVTLATPAVHAASETRELTVGLILGGGPSPFPLFPWLAFFLTGMSLGFASEWLGVGTRRAVVLIATGSVLAGAASLIMGQWLTPTPIPSPGAVVQRGGLVLVGIGLLGLAPSKWGQVTAPLGRRTLSIYFFHIILVYGGLKVPGLVQWVGRSLQLGKSLALGFLVLLVSVGLSVAWTRIRHLGTSGWLWLRQK